MTYPASIDSFTTKVGFKQQITNESHTIPVSPYSITLSYQPYEEHPSFVTVTGSTLYAEVYTTPTSSGQFLVSYATGLITFYSAQSGDSIQVSYKCAGDVVRAVDMDSVQTSIVNIETVLGVNPQGPGGTTVADRIEAPLDGATYGRKDGSWSSIVGLSGTSGYSGVSGAVGPQKIPAYAFHADTARYARMAENSNSTNKWKGMSVLSDMQMILTTQIFN